MTLGWPAAISAQHRRIADRQAALPLDGAAPGRAAPPPEPDTDDDRLCAEHAAAVARLMAEIELIRRAHLGRVLADRPADVALATLRALHARGQAFLAAPDAPGAPWRVQAFGLVATGPDAETAAAAWARAAQPQEVT